MRMTHAHMYSRFLASDPAWNGRFFTGVLTTGIYCLPSCHARKPKAENVRFFPSCDAARAAGLRPCLKCHPDDFSRGADPVLESIETLVAEVRADPGALQRRPAVVRRSGFGTTRCFELFRQHYHATPADLLLRAKDRRGTAPARSPGLPLAEVAAGAGFESLSAFHEHFRSQNGMTPSGLPEAGRPWALHRRPPARLSPRPPAQDPRARPAERHRAPRRGDYETAVGLGRHPGAVRIEFTRAGAASRSRTRQPRRGQRVAAHRLVVGILGLDQDAAGLRRLARRLGWRGSSPGAPACGSSGPRASGTGFSGPSSASRSTSRSPAPQATPDREHGFGASRRPLLPADARGDRPPRAVRPAPVAVLEAEGRIPDRGRPAGRRRDARPRGPARDVRDPGRTHAPRRARPRALVRELPDDALAGIRRLRPPRRHRRHERPADPLQA
jgi:methylphosphotriester-DNA--protein-cysteine methyltransferase